MSVGFAILAMCTALLSSGGCAESAIAAAGATAGFSLAQGQVDSFIRGELKSARLVPLERAHHAVHQAMAEMQLQVYRDRTSKYDGAVAAKAEGGREIKVYLKSDSPVITRITVRVGLFGDRAVSSLAMERIDRALALSEAAATHPATMDIETAHEQP